MMKKYKLTNETIQHNGKTLYRIEALRDFNNVKKGDKGGFIECEDNLSQEDNCWIYDVAKVFDNAYVYGNARIHYLAEVYNSARVYDSAIIYNKAKIFDYAKVCGHTDVCGSAKVYEKAVVSNNVLISGNSKIHGEVKVNGNAYITDAEISKIDDYIVFKNWWSSGRYFTWTKSNNMWRVGCFYGTGDELIAKAYRDSELIGREYERIVRYVEAINEPIKHARSLNRIQKIVCKLFRLK